MFDNMGELVVLGLAVLMTWIVTWAVAEWRMVRHERRVTAYMATTTPTPRSRTTPGRAEAAGTELSSVRVLPAPEHLRRTA